MKTIVKLFAMFAAIIFALVAVIKIVQKCSWKDAVGILEEFINEMRENCPVCCNTTKEEDVVAEEVEE
ncbi:MAG: hypothetical protein JXB48_07425 [Candidatus Latescibacteria bacterium]|nr:hypothetical protein [Candidatus Latescibacterota bacterium]